MASFFTQSLKSTREPKFKGKVYGLEMPVILPLAGSPDAPQQYKQPSRKGKKAWRKNVDVSEVEKGLETRNEEIIKG